MTERGPAPTNDEAAADTTASEEQPQTDTPGEPIAAPGQGESETPAAQRRARLRKEIRAGMQRAIKQ